MATWGGTSFTVRKGGYSPTAGDFGMKEITILPSPGTQTPVTVLQQAGNGRWTASVSIWISNLTDYNNLVTDGQQGIQRAFVDDDGVSRNCVIQKLGSLTRTGPVGANQWSVQMDLIESD